MIGLPKPHPTLGYRTPANRSSALVVVLFMVVILTIIIVAFMVTSTLDRASSQSYSQGITADQVGLGGLAQVVTDLQQEIAANSTASNYMGYTNFTPIAATNAQPELSLAGNTAATAPNLVTNLVMNLVKISSHVAPPYAQGSIEATSVNSTTNPSLNGRFISTNRWNKPAMIVNYWPAAATLQTPDWVNVSRSGISPQTLTVAQAKDSSFGNTNYVVGRYAYAVYDEGGMLDVTVAGYTTNTAAGMTNTIWGRKGNLALADLTQIPTNTVPQYMTQAQVEALVAFRNNYSTNNYANYITNTAPTNGFLYVQGNGTQSDNTFVSRQDLINYATTNGFSGAIPYLSTFSREKNRPSWYPTQDSIYFTDASGTIHGNNLYQYHTLMDSVNATNSDIPNVRVTTSFTRRDGSSAVVGEPLLKRRFPLSQLALLSVASPSTAQLALIQKYFGLVPDSASTTAAPIWDYVTPNGSSSTPVPATAILRLPQVAALNGTSGSTTAPREPDFFELLKAAILTGSIGLSPGTPINGGGHPGVFGDVDGISKNSDAQIIQIGADIIDQYRTGNYPINIYTKFFTAAAIGSVNPCTGYDAYNHFYGKKNLPYLTRVFQIGTLDPPGSTYQGTNMAPASTATGFNVWYTPEFYYPHQSATSSPGPTAYRFLAWGSESETQQTQHLPTTNNIVGNPVDYGLGANGISGATATGQINLTPTGTNFYTMPRYASANSGCSIPAASATLLQSLMATAGSTSQVTLNASGCITATGSMTSSDIPMGIWGGYDTISPGYSYTFNANPVLNMISFAMQYQDSAGNWQTYSTWKDAGYQQNLVFPTTVSALFWNYAPPLGWAKYDPRTDRFGEGLDYPNSSSGAGKLANTTAGQSYGAYLALWSTTPNPASALTSSLRPDHLAGGALNSACPPTSSDVNVTIMPNGAFTYSPALKVGSTVNGFAGGLWADNLAVRSTALTSASGGNTVNAYYADRDGVIRRGDGGYGVSNTSTTVKTSAPYTDGFPQAPGDNSAKPIVLSRPFRSVGEMGYAYRDMPFKSIDFFTAESADAALLDLFCLDDVDMAAGKLNPNTRNVPALQAMIAGSIKAENTPTSTINASASAAVANALVAHTANVSNGPLVNRSELVNKFSNDLTTALGGLSDVSDYYNKAQRESVVRALADVSNTRTWNLMIDVIAQSGHYSPSAGSLNDFNVQGERRYWLHVAIDRYTGKIIDQQLEPVHE